jgi:RNA-directed DNA polymerase
MTKPPSSLPDRRRRISPQAKAAPSWRFWGLDVQGGKGATRRAAYRLGNENTGAPGSAGGPWEAVAADGGETFRQQLQDALVTRPYRPLRWRPQAMPQAHGQGVRGRASPPIRARVGPGACKRMLAPSLEAAVQPGAAGYRPKRSAPDAVLRVAEAMGQDQTRVLDVDGQAYCANLRPPLLLAHGAQRGKAPAGLHVRKLMRQAAGQPGVAPGGVRSPLRRHL